MHFFFYQTDFTATNESIKNCRNCKAYGEKNKQYNNNHSMWKYSFRHMKNIFDDISGRVTYESYIYICPPGKTKVNIKKWKKEMWFSFVKMDLQVFWISKYNYWSYFNLSIVVLLFIEQQSFYHFLFTIFHYLCESY